MSDPSCACIGLPSITEARHKCRRSMSPQFEEKTTYFLLGEKAMLSHSQPAGVRAVTSPPPAGIEYSRIHPSISEAKTSRSSAAQFNTFAPAIRGYESFSVLPLRQTSRASPVAASATQIAHGSG